MRWKRPAQWMVDHVAVNLRKVDDLECRFAYGISGAMALQDAAVGSEILKCICADDGEPLAVAGVNGSVIWLLATDGLTATPGRRQALALGGRRWVDALLRSSDIAVLENWVLATNVESIRWLRAMGFTIDTAQPMGPSCQLFCHAWRQADDN